MYKIKKVNWIYYDLINKILNSSNLFFFFFYVLITVIECQIKWIIQSIYTYPELILKCLSELNLEEIEYIKIALPKLRYYFQ